MLEFRVDCLPTVPITRPLHEWERKPNGCRKSHIGMGAHLIKAIEMVLHAFYGNILPILDALCFQYLRECSFTLFCHQPVLCQVEFVSATGMVRVEPFIHT